MAIKVCITSWKLPVLCQFWFFLERALIKNLTICLQCLGTTLEFNGHILPKGESPFAFDQRINCMRLKSIKLAGFKSFVDATTVPFTSNMTAIVGPNGCGKSNVIDAVRWVMGESSAKNLRGESMTDVIFNGSSARQPVGQASIELLFDNSEGKLQGEHAAFSDISIRRKVTREGVSQYYLNGAKCRRRDVTDIFLGTGMGPRSYAIIEQGMITRLIESKPEELRVYLEEAAGISKYKERRRETENRMRRTQDNLDRLNDIREELAKQLQHLQRQAKAAEKYKEYKAEQRLTVAKLNALQWQTYDDEYLVLEKAAVQLENRVEQHVLDKLSRQNAIENCHVSLQDKQQSFDVLQSRFYKNGSLIAKLEQQHLHKKELFARQTIEAESLSNRLQQLLEQQSGLGRDVEEQSAHVLKLEPQLEAVQENTEQLHIQLHETEDSLQRWQQEWDAFTAMRAEIKQSVEVAKSKIEQQEARLRHTQTRQERLIAEQSRLSEALSILDIDGLTEQRAAAEEAVLAHQKKVAASEEALAFVSTQIREADQEKRELSDHVAQSKAVLASLNTLQKAAFDESDDAHADWLRRHDLQGRLHIFERIKVEAGWEAALEHVLAPWLKGLCCDEGAVSSLDLTSLTKSLTLLVDDENGDGTSLENRAVKPNLASRVSGAEAFDCQLQSVFTADNLEQALSMRAQLSAGESIVCPDGTWLSRDWVRYYRVHEAASGFIKRKHDIDLLEADLKVTQDELLSLDGRLEALQGQRQISTQEYKSGESQLAHAQRQYNQFDTRLQTEIANSDQYFAQQQRVEEELLEIEHQNIEGQELLMLDRARWSDGLERLDQLCEEEQRAQSEGEQLKENVVKCREAIRLSQERFHQSQIQLQQLQHELKLLRQQQENCQHSIDVLERQRTAENAEQKVKQEDLDELALMLEGHLEVRLVDEARLAEAKEQVAMLSQQIRDLEAQRTKSDEQIQSLRSDLEAKRLALQALDIKKTASVSAIEEQGFSLGNVIDQIEVTENQQSVQQFLDALTGRIQRLGAINLAAIDEYDEKSERKTYLDAQHGELDQALSTLSSAIKKIDKETRERFKATYDQVNEGLQRLFPKIFGGGSAHLELTEDDLLETGVTIIARPPGKKNATIHLLSGGEKALTAIALIFAIFELNPAPFCMLDEVDAPLDDANVGRFANMVKEMSASVQFIYISHNKVSMEKADQLMGVTMHEPGVSRLVSVDVDEAAELAQA